jgi:hypothetical protein
MQQMTSFPLGSRGTPLVGSLPNMRRKGMLQFYRDLWRDYGDLVHFKMGPLHQFPALTCMRPSTSGSCSPWLCV